MYRGSDLEAGRAGGKVLEQDLKGGQCDVEVGCKGGGDAQVACERQGQFQEGLGGGTL